jgi:methionine-S-sulfoxide reductase
VVVTLLVAVAAVGAVLVRRAADGGEAPAHPRTAYGDARPGARTETATFAAGCFWKLEHAMRGIHGVVATTSGYTGGDSAAAAPTHAAVSTGATGHAEAVRVEFDPAAVSYERLLDAFWASHDPAQFVPEPGEPPMPGRSAIFYHTDAQREAAAESVRRVRSSEKYAGADLPTEVLPAGPFVPAEAEHQQYVERHAGGRSCRVR